MLKLYCADALCMPAMSPCRYNVKICMTGRESANKARSKEYYQSYDQIQLNHLVSLKDQGSMQCRRLE